MTASGWITGPGGAAPFDNVLGARRAVAVAGRRPHRQPAAGLRPRTSWCSTAVGFAGRRSRSLFSFEQHPAQAEAAPPSCSSKVSCPGPVIVIPACDRQGGPAGGDHGRVFAGRDLLDNVSVQVNAIVFSRVVDPEKAIIQVKTGRHQPVGPDHPAQEASKHELDEMLIERERLNIDAADPRCADRQLGHQGDQRGDQAHRPEREHDPRHRPCRGRARAAGQGHPRRGRAPVQPRWC